uniref:(northern house mosquito) hypothetical protein n=1 Tax=Culex pipiens TaxID=7175 RepID=A0A8D8BSJ5_CULPI
MRRSVRSWRLMRMKKWLMMKSRRRKLKVGTIWWTVKQGRLMTRRSSKMVMQIRSRKTRVKRAVTTNRKFRVRRRKAESLQRLKIPTRKPNKTSSLPRTPRCSRSPKLKNSSRRWNRTSSPSRTRTTWKLATPCRCSGRKPKSQRRKSAAPPKRTTTCWRCVRADLETRKRYQTTRPSSAKPGQLSWAIAS